MYNLVLYHNNKNKQHTIMIIISIKQKQRNVLELN